MHTFLSFTSFKFPEFASDFGLGFVRTTVYRSFLITEIMEPTVDIKLFCFFGKP